MASDAPTPYSIHEMAERPPGPPDMASHAPTPYSIQELPEPELKDYDAKHTDMGTFHPPFPVIAPAFIK